MKYFLFLIMLISLMTSSCTTAYRNTQTPDDVYYSDGRPEGMLMEETEPEYPNRMKCRDRRWRTIDYGCAYDPYHYGYNSYYYYNPHYYPYPVFNYTPVINSTPRYSNLGSYYNNTRTIVNIKTGESNTLRSADAYNNSNTDSRLIRSSGTTNSSGSDSRTYSPSNNNSTSNPGRSISRPTRN